MTSIGKTELVKRIVNNKSNKGKYSQEQVASIIDNFLQEIKKALKTKEGVAFKGFFSFIVKKSIRKDLVGKMQCDKDKLAVVNHKTSKCCGKEIGGKMKKGIKDFAKCSKFKNLTKQIRECHDCQKAKASVNKLSPDYISLKLSPELRII